MPRTCTKAVEFQQVVDSRFSKSGNDKSGLLREMLERDRATLSALDGIAETVRHGEPRFLEFPPEASTGIPTVQYRTDFLVKPLPGKNYGDVYAAVNSVRAVPYKLRKLP